MQDTAATQSSTPVRDAVRARRSTYHFRPDRVPTDLLRTLLEAGTWAPNHKLSEPWRFVIVGPATHAALADRYAALQAEGAPAGGAARATELAAAGRAKLLSKPTLVAVSCVRAAEAFRAREDYAAVCCAIQNIQLAAWEAGVGVQWSTGALTRDAEALGQLGIDPDREEVVGLLYMGYPERVSASRRRPVDEVVRETP